jgi:uncharacterized tellurite resistance protein B-like protein
MSALTQMKLLISLAQIDGNVAEREKNYIINIGRANGIYPDEITPLFSQRHDLIIPKNLDKDQRFNMVFNLVQLMKIDERMYKEEILFCSKVAANLGYDQEAMFDFLLHVKTAAMGSDEVESLKRITSRYLKD